MKKVLTTIGIMIMLLLAAVPMISSASAEQNVCRDLPSETQAPGSVITVYLTATVGSATIYAIDEVVPSGWTVTGASDAGDYTSDPGHVKWVITSGAVDKTYTYTVQIPGDASGTSAFSGEFQMEGMSSPDPIDCDTTITVGGIAASQNVCRDLPSETQAPGSVITVSLTATVGSATHHAIDEVVPSGWTVTGASDAGDYTSDPGHVKWVITSGAVDKTFTYTVQIPGDASGTSAFSGEFQMEGMSSPDPIDCDTAVTVGSVADGITLLPGWNFVSVPYELDNSSVDYVLADINYSLPVTYYNAATGFCEPVSDLEPLKGYWIKNPEEGTQVILGELLVPKATPGVLATLTVYEGWNAIGYTDPEEFLSAEVALSAIDESYITIKGPFDPVTWSYEHVGWNGQTGIISDSGKHVGTDVFWMDTYEAFWVFVTQEDMLNTV